MSNTERLAKAAILAMIDAPDASLFEATANLAIMTEALACGADIDEVAKAVEVCGGEQILGNVKNLRDSRDLLVTIGTAIATRGEGITTAQADQALSLLPGFCKSLDASDVLPMADDVLRANLTGLCAKAGESAAFDTPPATKGGKRRGRPSGGGSGPDAEKNRERAKIRRAQLKAAQLRIDDGTFPDAKANELIRKDGPLTKMSVAEIAAYKAPKATGAKKKK